MFSLTLSIALAFAIHESAHYLTARLYGHKLVFRRQGIRYIWDMPEDTKQHQKLIALSGFGAEVIVAPLLYLVGLWAYPFVVVGHLVAYKFYAGEYSDWKWL